MAANQRPVVAPSTAQLNHPLTSTLTRRISRPSVPGWGHSSAALPLSPVVPGPEAEDRTAWGAPSDSHQRDPRFHDGELCGFCVPAPLGETRRSALALGPRRPAIAVVMFQTTVVAVEPTSMPRFDNPRYRWPLPLVLPIVGEKMARTSARRTDARSGRITENRMPGMNSGPGN